MAVMEATKDEVTLKEAARRLGIAERTLRKRIQEGKVPAHKSPGTLQGEWRVRVGDPAPLTEEAMDRQKRRSAPAKPAPEPEPALTPIALPTVPEGLYRDLLAKYEALIVRLGYLQSRHEDYERLLMEQNERKVEHEPVRELPAPQETVPLTLYQDLMGRYEQMVAQAAYLQSQHLPTKAAEPQRENVERLNATVQILQERLGAANQKIQFLDRTLQETQAELERERSKGVMRQVFRKK